MMKTERVWCFLNYLCLIMWSIYWFLQLLSTPTGIQQCKWWQLCVDYSTAMANLVSLLSIYRTKYERELHTKTYSTRYKLILPSAELSITTKDEERLRKGKDIEIQEEGKWNSSYDFIFKLSNVQVDISIHAYPVRFASYNRPLIPDSLRKRFGVMLPSRFMSFIFEDLTQEERESLMREESYRRNSFCNGWPHRGSLSATNMAKAGFYHSPHKSAMDRVQCVFCRGMLKNWESNDEPMTEHAANFPKCRFVRGLNCGNEPYYDPLAPSNGLLLFASSDASSERDERPHRFLSSLNITPHPVPISIKYKLKSERQQSFPHHLSYETRKTLSEAGFFYTSSEHNEKVECFFCGFILAGTSDHAIQHARWSPDCQYLIRDKGELFIERVRSTTDCIDKTITAVDRLCSSPSCHFSDYPDFASRTRRLSSFDLYAPAPIPENRLSRDTREALSDSGFFCDEDGQIKCFYCSTTISADHARTCSDGWTQHAQPSTSCRFLIQQQGSITAASSKLGSAEGGQ